MKFFSTERAGQASCALAAGIRQRLLSLLRTAVPCVLLALSLSVGGEQADPAATAVATAGDERFALEGLIDSRLEDWRGGARISLIGVSIHSAFGPGGEMTAVEIDAQSWIGPDVDPRQGDQSPALAPRTALLEKNASAHGAQAGVRQARIVLRGVIRSPDFEASVPPTPPRIALTGRIESSGVALKDVVELADLASKSLDRAATFSTERSRSRLQALSRLLRADLATFVRADAVDYTDGDREETVTASAQATLSAELQQPRWSLRGTYDLEAAEYLVGEFDPYLNHTFLGAYQYRLSRRDRIDLSASRSDMQDRRDGQFIDDFQATASGSYRQISDRLALAWQGGAPASRWRHSVALTHSASESTFTDSPGFKQEALGVTASVLYRLRRRLSLLADGAYEALDYDERSDSTQGLARLGVELNLSRRLTSRLLLGYESKRFQGEDGADGILNYEAGVNWQASRRDVLTMNASRALTEIFERAEDDVAPNAFATQTALRIAWERRIAARWRGNSTLAYQRQDPVNSSARSENWQWQTTGSFTLSDRVSLSAACAYTLTEDATRGDYDRWTVTLRADFRGRSRPSGRTAL